MSDFVLKIVAGVLFSLWLLLVLPGWVLGMFYANRFLLVPDMPMSAEFWTFVAAFYVPPIITGITVYRMMKAKRKDQSA